MRLTASSALAHVLLFSALVSCLCWAAFDDSAFLPSNAVKKLANKHVVMIGDSLMRYQYLSLVYAIKFGVKLTDSQDKNFVRESTWSGWPEFYAMTNKALRPEEYCDCYKSKEFDYSKLIENRFFEDKEKKIKINFMFLNGVSTQGHWRNSNDSNMLRMPQSEFMPATWRNNLPDTLDTFVKPLVDKNSHSVLILNAGHHKHFFDNRTYAAQVSQAAKYFTQVVWKTTSFIMPLVRPALKPGETWYPHDRVMCSQPAVTCFNLSWSKNVSSEHFTDFLHYTAPVYNLINAQMVDLIDKKSYLSID